MSELLLGDCLERLKELPDCSVDSIVTDPPYGLKFMGKKWDHGIPAKDFWIEAIRVAKPGAHLLAFGGTRTYHRLACAIEDAGWEIRDCIMWVYGSGFPKSHDVSKAIDYRRATNDLIRPWLKTLGTREEIAKAAGVTPRQVYYWLSENTPSPHTLTADRFKSLCSHFGCVPDWAEAMFPMLGEKIGEITHARSGGNDFGKRPNEKSASRTVDVHEPATVAARTWKGWGTALKPAWEPIIVARKPLCGTVAENVQKWGCGGLNIDGTRVGVGEQVPGGGKSKRGSDNGMLDGNGEAPENAQPHTQGRWPANLVLSHSPHCTDDQCDIECAVLALDTQSGTLKSGSRAAGVRKGIGYQGGQGDGGPELAASQGGASRFFYCAKASPSERGEDNNHPTVKPQKLMRYLCRLITPPAGTVLDPFMGSGSTGMAAKAEGFGFIGIERDAEYYKIAEARITNASRD